MVCIDTYYCVNAAHLDRICLQEYLEGAVLILDGRLAGGSKSLTTVLADGRLRLSIVRLILMVVKGLHSRRILRSKTEAHSHF